MTGTSYHSSRDLPKRQKHPKVIWGALHEFLVAGVGFESGCQELDIDSHQFLFVLRFRVNAGRVSGADPGDVQGPMAAG